MSRDAPEIEPDNQRISLVEYREEIFTVPNSLTLARLPLAAAVWVAPSSATYVLAIVAIAALTDVFDGRVARTLRRRRVERGDDPGRLGEADAIGAWLDPICDKIFVASVVIAISVGFHPPLYAAFLIATRELLLLPLAVIRWCWPWFRDTVPVDFRAGIAGKATTTAQFAAIVAIMTWMPGVVPLAVLAGVLGAIAVAVYVRRGVVLARHSVYNPIGMSFEPDAAGDSGTE